MIFSKTNKHIFNNQTAEKNAEKSAYKPVFDGFSKNRHLDSLTKKLRFRLWDCYHYIFVATFIIALFSFALSIYKIYPFGDKIIASYDMLAQIVPFIEHLFDVFSGKSSLFYSTAVGGGTDVFGTLCYCLISPFTWIFLLFGSGNVYYGVSIVLPLKLIVIGFSALYFLGKVFPSLSKTVRIVFALLYSYCGYVFVANTYINWLDLLIYLPFTVIGFKKIVSEGKILYFSIAYALMIYTCFSLASFAMIIVFMIIVLYYIFVCRPNKDVFVKSCLALLLSVTMALPVLVPSFLCYLSSERSTSIFDNLGSAIDATHLYRKLTYIISDVFFLFLTLVYFVKNGVNRPIDRFLLATGVLLLMPVLVDECCNLLNFGSYLGYAQRFGFLHSFYLFFVSSKLTAEWTLSKPKPYKASVKQNIVFGLIIGVTVLLSVLYAVFADEIIGVIDKIYKAKDSESSYGFYSLFAHALGGLEYIGPYALLVAISLAICLTCYLKRKCDLKIIATFLCVTIAISLGLYNVSLVKGNKNSTTYYEQFDQAISLISNDDENNNGYFRIKDTTDSLTADAALTTHTNSFAIFSSAVDSKNFTATEFFKYLGNGINNAKSTNGMFLGDMLLGYKYYFHREDRGENTEYLSAVDRPYIEKLDYTELNNFTIYENKAVFPTAFTVKSGDLKFNGLNYAQKLDKLYNFLGGEGVLCDEYPLLISDEYDSAVLDLGNGIFQISVVIETKHSYWFLTTDFPEEFDVYYCKAHDYNDESAKKLEKGQDIYLNYYKSRYASYVITIKDLNGKLTKEDVAAYCKYYGVQTKTVYNPDGDNETLYDTVWKNKVDFSISGGNTFTVSCNAADDNTYLFLSYVKLGGHKVTINGKSSEFIDNDLDFMLIKLNKGVNLVTIQYRSPYIKYAVFGLIGALLLGLLIFFIVKKIALFSLTKGVIYIAGIVLFVIVFGFFILLPLGAFLSKLIYAALSAIF